MFFGLFKKFIKFIRGGAGPVQIILSCLLGMMIGMNPVFGLTTVVGILLVVLLNVNLGMVLLTAALGKLLGWVLAPVTFEIGFVIIHNIGLEGLFRWFGDTPVLALMDLHRYCFVGGLPIAIAAGVGIGWVFARIIVRIRKGVAAATDKHTFLAKAGGNFFIRLLMRIFLGKQKGTMAEMLERKPPVIRKAGIVVCVVLAVMLIGGPVVLVDYVLAGALEEQLTQANGAEVNIAKADLSFFGGTLNIEGLQITDPAKATHNQMQAEKITIDLNTTALLARRIEADSIEAVGVRSDEKRDKPGFVVPAEKEEEEPPEAEPDLFEYLEKGKEYYEKYGEYLEKLKEMLEQGEAKQEEDLAAQKEQLKRDRLTEGYFALTAAHILSKHPRAVVHKLLVDRIKVAQAGEDAPLYRIEGEEISTEPALNDKPMVLRLGEVGSDGGEVATFGKQQHAFVTLMAHEAGKANPIDVLWKNADVKGLLGEKAAINIREGTADIMAKGNFTARKTGIPFEIKLRNMKAEPKSGKGMFGLDPETSKQVLAAVNRMTVVGTLEGPLPIPVPVIDAKKTLESIVGDLDGALKSAVNKQVKKLEAEAKKAAEAEIKKTIETGELPTSLPTSLPGGIKDTQGHPQAVLNGQSHSDGTEAAEAKERFSNPDWVRFGT